MAINAAPANLVQEVSRACQGAGLTFVVLPPVREMIGGHVRLEQIRKVDVADLLGRRPIKTDIGNIASCVRDKVVLITGAGGSIGSELARQVHRLNPRQLVLLDRDESALHGVQLSLYGTGLLDSEDIVLCDIRDMAALEEVFDRHRPEVVFHAAALKHLPLLERFPLEGWKTNVVGTANVLACSRRVGVERLVNISTDKAADATSVLGQTKRLAERLTAWHAQDGRLPYVSVRFGNVLGSRGSVLHAFRSQIERGGPVTVTHPEVTRFFMTIPEACELVLQAGAIGRPGDVMVLDMGEPVRILDVARLLIEESGRDIRVVFTGLRPGEKLNESLFGQLENHRPSEHLMISQVNVPALNPDDLPMSGDDLLSAFTAGAISVIGTHLTTDINLTEVDRSYTALHDFDDLARRGRVTIFNQNESM
jgi:dTDP-glucose 4,6-dehydratase